MPEISERNHIMPLMKVDRSDPRYFRRDAIGLRVAAGDRGAPLAAICKSDALLSMLAGTAKFGPRSMFLTPKSGCKAALLDLVRKHPILGKHLRPAKATQEIQLSEALPSGYHQ